MKFCMGLGMRTLSIDIKVGSESSMVLYYTDFNHQSLRIPDFTHTESTDVPDENAILYLWSKGRPMKIGGSILGLNSKRDTYGTYGRKNVDGKIRN